MPDTQFARPLNLPKTSRALCLLVACTLIGMTGCSLIGPKKGAARNSAANAHKFSCGEDCPKGRTP